jgi:hypothetical protein
MLRAVVQTARHTIEHHLSTVSNIPHEAGRRRTKESLIYSSHCWIGYALPESSSEVPGEEKQCSGHDIGADLCRDIVPPLHVTTGSNCFREYFDTALLVVHLELIRSWVRSDFRMNSDRTIFALFKRKRDD